MEPLTTEQDESAQQLVEKPWVEPRSWSITIEPMLPGETLMEHFDRCVEPAIKAKMLGR